MAPAIAVCASVTKVLVGENYLGDKGATVLCDALRESKVTKVQELDLGDNEIGPAGAKAVAAMAAVVASVTSVTLLANRFDDATVGMLLKLKEEKPTLMTLCGLQPNQTEANFMSSGLTPQDAKLLAPEILVHASLTSVR